MTNVKKIVSVQDISCYGQCSLTAALPVLSAKGVETAILPSAVLSTHTGGFHNYTVLDLTQQMPKIVAHWRQEGIRFDAIYTGYIGDARQFATILGMRDLLRDGGLLIVDPAMADRGKLYAALGKDIVDGMRTLVRQADVILPNQTEAAFLLGRAYKESYTLQESEEMLRALCAMGPRYCILTGVRAEPGQIGAACLDAETGQTAFYFTPRVEKSFHGTGDLFSACAVADIVRAKPMQQVLENACTFTYRAICATADDPAHTYGVHFEPVLSGEYPQSE